MNLDSKTGKEYPTDRREQYLEHSLPSSPESEQVVLGAIILDNRILVPASIALTPDDFYSTTNRAIFAAMLTLHHRSSPIDPILIGEELKKLGLLESSGGVTAITNLSFGMPHFSNVDDYIAVVKDKSDLREIIRVCEEITKQALSQESASIDVRSAASTRLAIVGDVAGYAPASVAEVWADVQENFVSWQNDDRPTGIPTGIPELDACLRYRGIAKSDLVFIAARPSIGKSALMLQLATAAAAQGFTTAVYTLEMSPRDLFLRTLPARSGVKNFSINPMTVRHNEEARNRLYQAGDAVSQLPVYFDGSAFNIDRLLSRAEYAITRLGVKYVLIDYLQLIKTALKSRRRDQEFEFITGELKQLALRHNVPVVCLAQLSRGSGKEERRPEMSDIREAGSSEQDADLVILPYRETPRSKKLGGHYRKSIDDMVDEEVDANADIVKVSLYIAKQRNGKAGIEVPVSFDMDMQRFMSASMWESDRLDKME